MSARPVWLRLLRGLGWLGLAGLVAGWGVTLTARWWWVGELAVSFAWVFGWCGLAGALLLLVVGLRRAAAAALVVGALLVWPEAKLWLPDARAGALETPAPELVVASCNLLWDDPDMQGFLDLLDREDPDVIALQEVALRNLPLPAFLAERYPHLALSPALERWNDGTWGTAFLSRVPFTATHLVPPPEGVARPALEVGLELAGQPVVLRNVHPMRPGKAWRIELRNLVLDQLAELPWGERDVLLGDLNTASSSPAFADLVDGTGLRDTRRGFGRQATWTTSRHLAGLEVAIDHVLVGDAWHVVERRVVGVRGSDHRAVVARLALVAGTDS